MSNSNFRTIYPECLVCMEPIKPSDEECYIFDGPGPEFNNCVCRRCMKQARRQIRQTVDEAIFNDWDEYIFTRLKPVPTPIEEEF